MGVTSTCSKAKIRVELGSMDEADLFRGEISDVDHTFDISIKLGWRVTWSNVKNFAQTLAT